MVDRAPSAASDLAYCLDLIRRGDRERYLTTLLAPAASRAALVAIYAFKHEVEKTHAVVSEPRLGQIRLQWWRESLDGAFAGNPRRHAVVGPLATAIGACALPRAQFDAIVDTHERDIDPAPFASMEDLAEYCAAVEGSVIALAMAVAPEARVGDARELARSAGIGFGIARLLRRMGPNLRSGPMPIPADVAEAHGIDPAAIRQLAPDDPRLAGAVTVVAVAAAKHLRTARASFRGARGTELPALMHCTIGGGLLARLRRAGYNPFDARVSEPAPGEIWRLLAARVAGRAVLAR